MGRALPCLAARLRSQDSSVAAPSIISKETLMPKAIWNDAVIAQTERFETVEGNIYFPPESLDMQYLRPSEHHTTCPWKGVASYYDVVVNGEVNKDGAWYYPAPKPAASNIAGYVAFWRGVKVIP
jgi:uncharacterized protein (DUF427 family)